jgi:hypothetical protein
MAVKDCGKIDRMNWTNAVYWRDYLPREIAIQKRVDDQGGLSSIHKFWGYRLSMLQRSYRLYNDFCALGAFVHAFEYYSKQWRMRRILYQRRIEGQAWPEKDKDKHPDFQQGVWKDEQFDPNDGKLTVIPEGFLWETFQHLVNACLVLRDGAGTDVGGNKSWHPIVHKDMHIGNVFLKLPKGCRELLADFSSGTTLDTFFQTHYSAKGRREAVTTYRLNEYSAGGLVSTPDSCLCSFTNRLSGQQQCWRTTIRHSSTCRVATIRMRTIQCTISFMIGLSIATLYTADTHRYVILLAFTKPIHLTKAIGTFWRP